MTNQFPATEEKDAALDELVGQFTYHAPTLEQRDALLHIRNAAHAFARAIVRNCPKSADRSAAIRKVREAVMTANAGVVLYAPAPGEETGRTFHEGASGDLR